MSSSAIAEFDPLNPTAVSAHSHLPYLFHLRFPIITSNSFPIYCLFLSTSNQVKRRKKGGHRLVLFQHLKFEHVIYSGLRVNTACRASSALHDPAVANFSFLPSYFLFIFLYLLFFDFRDMFHLLFLELSLSVRSL